MTMKEKPWGGRFREQTDKQVEAFTASIHIDKRLYLQDIEGSIAHAKMLAKQRIISKNEGEKIIKALNIIKMDMQTGSFTFSEDDEDIHMAIEKALIRKIGETGEKLHTARSRNDQVALDMRLYLREQIKQITAILKELKVTFLERAEKEIDTIMPGYTHMQRAQPVLLAHYLMAYWEMLDRDETRLNECYIRTNIMPLGACALAGTGLPIDREYTARLLKFPSLSKNSIDAVSDRDFAIEFISDAAMLMMHLSRFSEDIIVWSTSEFNFVEIDDAFTTGSSIMPQKKNPDVAELIRGKTSRIYGNLMTILTLMKGLPMTYNRDLQEDKGPLFDTADTLKSSLQILNAMLKRLKFNKNKMFMDAGGGFSTATDLAEYLVKKGVPFRSAHGIVGEIVAYCINKRKTLDALSMDEYHVFHDKFDNDIYSCLTVENSVNARCLTGGTSKTAVLKRIKALKRNRKVSPDGP
jgi:argininosuccinate lyase